METNTRKHYTPEQKIMILGGHLLENAPISDLCQKHSPRSQALGRYEVKVGKLEARLKNKDEVIAELLEEHIKLKKVLGRFERLLGDP